MNGLRYWLAPWVILAVTCTAAVAGSPFYLTVDRSFSNAEPVSIRLDYAQTEPPILIRVMKPVKLESFLDGQLQISRSYETPTSELNPGHYFVKGLNQLQSPLKAFRDMIDADFRKSLKQTQIHKSILNTTNERTASAPQKIIVGPPAGFTVEREFYIDLTYGGESVHDLGWWFWHSAWDEYMYKIRTVTLDPLPDGIYMIHAVQGNAEAQSLLQVSSLSVQVKQSTSQLVARVMDRQLNPVPDAALSYRDGRGRWIPIPAKTDASGEVFFSNPEGVLDGKLIVKTETPDKRQALTETDFLPSASADDSVFIVTDRPIFKPGETFYFKGVVRWFKDGNLTVPAIANKDAAVSLIRADGEETEHSGKVKITDFGTFSGSFDLDENESPGLYRLVAAVENKPYGGEFRVRDYVKPEFYLELTDRSPSAAAGEKFFVRFTAKRYSGGVSRHIKYEVYLYKKKFEAPQWVMEAGAGLSAGTDYFGEIRSVSGLTDPKRIYSSVEERLGEFPDFSNTWDSAPATDDNGVGSFEFVIPKTDADLNKKADDEWIYTLMIRAMDSIGSQAVLTENMYITLSEAQSQVMFSKTVAEPGDKEVKLLIRTTYPDGSPAPKGGGVIDLTADMVGKPAQNLPKLSFTTDDKGTGLVTLPELTVQGRYSASATLETLDGKRMRRPSASSAAVMIVGGADGSPVMDNQEIELFCESTILSPGEKAKIFALLPAGWGNGESGKVWETVSGRKVYGSKAYDVAGRSRWFEAEAKPEYGTGFYQTFTVPVSGGKYREKTMGFRIIPTDKRLQIGIRPEKDETAPLTPFKIDFEVKDAAGNPAPETELAVTIVDRAVYAVQGELRPGIFDFFYPLPRQNLATFYSDELQGYGYADTLKKPNFRLGALKSQSKLVKKNMRDTAGWFPHVTTDANGRASVTVDMPANITEWVITAIAADKTGKAGEAKAGFRSASDVTVEVASPQFLRQGETTTVYVRTSTRLTRPVTVKARIDLSPDILLTDAPGNLPVMSGEVEFKVDKTADHLLPLTVEAASETGAAVIRIGLKTEENILVGGVNEFEIPLKPAAMTQVYSSIMENSRFRPELPENGTPTELKVQVHTGLLGAALNAAAVLVAYPFGCTEQLVHTTIPNLVLMDLIRNAGIDPKELGPLAKPLTTAQKNAASGIRKIILNQKQDGGFGYWRSDPNSSAAATLTALYALKFASDMEIDGASNAFFKGRDWLAQFLQNQPKYAFTGYELARFAELYVYNLPYDRMFQYIESVQKNPAAPASDLIHALKIFAAYRDDDWSRFAQRYKNTQVRAGLIARLQKVMDAFDEQTYIRAAAADAQLFETLGFAYGVPYMASSGMGALKDLNALPKGLEKKLAHILLRSMKNGYWISTFDTAQVIFNSRQIISEEAAQYRADKRAPKTASVRTSDGVIGNLTRIPAGYTGVFTNPGSVFSLSDIQIAGIDADAAGYASVTVNVPFMTLPMSQGLEVERTFFKITPKGSEIIDSPKSLTKGDVVISKVHVKRTPVSEMTAVRSQYIVVEDAIPSYGQGIDEDKTYLADAKIKAVDDTYWASVKEVRRHPDKTVVIAKVTPKGELTAYQVWKVAFDGDAVVPPARAYDMYNESINGNSETGLDF